ncbi:formylglycine-generating enzyme family protein [Marinobacter sp. C2H3]|uniref:formylglycine-generating enzyme family protein n=1 Tax=Marinobacter sp. C2H3 TaxID=3119003 RepID=UPI00300EE974
MHKSLLLPLVFLAGCTSHPITSKTLSEAEIADIQSRVEARYPELSTEKTQAVTELVVRALDNMVAIKGGTFMMGEFKIPCEPGSESLCYSDFYRDNDYAHKVTLGDYALSKYETTIKEFDLFRQLRGKKPYENELRQRESRQYLFAPKKPAWTRDWEEPNAYCQWIGQLAQREVSLPTEAQWEFAARNRGKNILYATDNGRIELGRNYTSSDDRSEMNDVGRFPANPLGIYDLSGNATEWVYDWYSETYYRDSPSYEPKGPQEGAGHVIRGGSNIETPDTNTTVNRYHDKDIGFYSKFYGFRCSTW